MNDSRKIEEFNLPSNDEFIKEYSTNSQVIIQVRKRFQRIGRIATIKLIKLILQNQIHINIKDLTKKWSEFYRYNKSKFDEKKELKIDIIHSLHDELNGLIRRLNKDIKFYEEENIDIPMSKIDGEDCYILDKDIQYFKIRNLTADEGGAVKFIYPFDKPDMTIKMPGTNNMLQRCEIQILSKGVEFDYPIEYSYTCPQCKKKINKKVYETICTKHKIKCNGIYYYEKINGEEGTKICGMTISPDLEIGIIKKAYYYDISYDDEDENKHSVSSISFKHLEPGFYECVLFKIPNPKKTELFQIMDVKPIKSNKLNIPEKKENINYLFTLQQSFDKYIKRQTGMEIYGLIPIKVALIIQKLFNILDFELVCNIQVCGSASSGKSTILKYWNFLLNSHMNLSTNGLSISIPGLRGTKQSITLMGKEQKIITSGYLGTFKTIHIDEAGENRELIDNLKTFLCESNYSYNKAESTGISSKRTAQLSISENLDTAHLGLYRGGVRKIYKDPNFVLNINGNELEKEVWDETWDLHQPLYTYDNLYLKEAIYKKRVEYKEKQIFWFDGYQIPLHERFPLAFYIFNEKRDKKLSQIVKGNITRDKISENLELIKVLKSDDINIFFESLKKYKDSNTDIEAFIKVDQILEEYNIEVDSRIESFFYNLIKVSRIINKRKDATEEDYNLLRWILEKINIKIDVMETINYKIKGPHKEKEEEKQEVEQVKTNINADTSIGSDFGIKMEE